MKKTIAFIFAFVLVFSLAGCQGKTDEVNNDTSSVQETMTEEVTEAPAEAVTLTGKVTAIDGTMVTLQLGELSEGGMPENSGSGEAPPEMPDGEQNGGEGGTPPEMPAGEQNGGGEGDTPPEVPDGEQNAGGEDNTPPEMPEGEQNGGGEGDVPPEMPGGDQNGSGQNGMPSGMPGGEGNNVFSGGMVFTAGEQTTTVDLTDAEITIEVAEGITDGTLSDISVGDILEIEIGADQTVTSVLIKNMSSGQPGGFGGSGEITQGSAANIIDEDGSYSGETVTSTGDDENTLRIVGAAVILDGFTVNKDSGATSNTEDGDFYGMNAALLATDGANVTITNAVVNSSAQNGNGVFSYGSGTVVNISDSTIITEKDNSGGIQTTGGGTTNAQNLQITTSGSSSAAIRSDRGGGTVNVDGGTYITNGVNSPAVYSTADITVKNAALTANNSEALVIEGQNSIALEDCIVTGNMSDTKGSSSDINVHNVMIYQSMSGDAEVGTSVFTMTGGSLTSNNGDMFYVTNTNCVLLLSGVEIINHETDGYFLLVSGNDASHGWGTAGSNGAQVDFTADRQTFEGDIAVDSISTLKMALTNQSTYTGAIHIIENAQNGSAAESNADITIDSDSIWNLTGDCTVTTLINNGTINFNGYTITLADGTVLSE